MAAADDRVLICCKIESEEKQTYYYGMFNSAILWFERGIFVLFMASCSHVLWYTDTYMMSLQA